MKFNFQKSIVLLSLLSTSVWMGCKKEETKTDPVPVVTVPVLAATTTVSAITENTATSGGNITATGGSDVLAKGVCYDTMPNPTFEDDDITSEGTGMGVFTSSLTNLKPGKKYYVRAYATNLKGIGYGSEVNFTTLAPTVVIDAPTITTSVISNPTATGAVSGGTISNEGGAGVSITEKGVLLSQSNPPELSDIKFPGSGSPTFVSNITGLIVGTTYFVRAYATNSAGKTGYGQVETFTTATLPLASITTLVKSDAYLVGNATTYTLAAGGTISSLNGSALVEKGIVWVKAVADPGASLDFTNNTGKKSEGDVYNTTPFTSGATGLDKFSTYWVRAYAKTNNGVAYGANIKVETFVKDIENNMYNKVKIGDYLWLKENLKVTKFNDGTPINKPGSASSWGTTDPAYAVQEDNMANKDIYGLLYNWYAASIEGPTGKNVCPVGWTLPTVNNGFTQLVTSAGNDLNKLKAFGWSGNSGDPLGFSAITSGQRLEDGTFMQKTDQAFYWAQDTYNVGGSNAYYFGVNGAINSNGTVPGISKKRGESVRCAKW